MWPPHDAGSAPEVSWSAWRDPVALGYRGPGVLRVLRDLALPAAQLTPTSWDLGIYTEYVKQLSLLHAPIVDVRGPGFNLLGDHFQIGVAVLAPFFRLFPSPATLLFFQALLTAVSVFPVMSAGTLLLGKASGRLIGFAYGFSWGLQQMIDFDFHEIALAVPLLAFSLSALVRGRVRAAALLGAAAGLREGGPGVHRRRDRRPLVFDGISASSRARPAARAGAVAGEPRLGGSACRAGDSSGPCSRSR